MKKIALSLILFLGACSACGMSARNNELVGQVKKVVDVTPVLCGDYTMADISLGIIRNGTGSMSKEDVEVVVNPADVVLLKKAAETGALVKITYDIRRAAPCTPDHMAVSAVLVEEGAK